MNRVGHSRTTMRVEHSRKVSGRHFVRVLGLPANAELARVALTESGEIEIAFTTTEPLQSFEFQRGPIEGEGEP